MTGGIYVASRVIHAPRWREYREDGLPIISTWIDEAGEGETLDFSELWLRGAREVEQANVLLFYGDVVDAPWKGALVEVGMALALRKPVVALVIGELEGRTMRPVGSWLAHPLVRRAGSIETALFCARRLNEHAEEHRMRTYDLYG